MENTLLQIIDEAIELELNMSKLYGIFSEHMKEDKAFWFRLEIEEINHAALLRASKDFVRFRKFPSGIIPNNLEILQDSNQKIREATNRFIDNPDRKLAFKLAYELENSAGEIHFQQFMEKEAHNNLSEIFQKLNRDDKDHAKRILEYRKSVLRDDNP